jgi:AcrR family transcriptional regulator
MMTLTSKRQRLARGHGDQLREEIITATAALLVDARSADEVSIRAIADRVGVTPPAIYRHFPDKDALLFHTCLTKWSKFAESVSPVFAQPGSALDKLQALGIEYVRFAVNNPNDYAIMLKDWAKQLPPGVNKDELPGMDVLHFGTQLIAQGVADGEIRDVDPFNTMVCLWAMVHGIATLARDHSDEVPPLQDAMVLAQQATEMLTRSLRVDPR